jgi:hypothetical protein
MPIASGATLGLRPAYEDVSVALSAGPGSSRRAVTIQEGERTVPLVREARLGPEGRDALVDLSLRALVLAATQKPPKDVEHEPERDEPEEDETPPAAAEARGDDAEAPPAPARVEIDPPEDQGAGLVATPLPTHGRRLDTFA